MSFPAYEHCAESGIEWVGGIPAHWTKRPLYQVSTECDRPNVGMVENNLLSLSYGAIVRRDIDSNDGLLPESFETYQVVEPNDIVWRLTDLQNDKRSLRTAIVSERGIITSAYLATRANGISPRYLNYLLRAYDQTKVFYSMGGGLRQSMKFADVRRMPVLVPSPVEQELVTAFLDREIGKIDALVRAQRRLIELLKEKRQAVISYVVTKGLDPTASMKDSGVEWLGDVPAHWEVAPLKRRWGVMDCKHVTAEFVESGWPLASIREIQSRFVDLTTARQTSVQFFDQLIDGGRQPQAGDLIFCRNVSVGEVAEVTERHPPFAMGQDVCLLRRRASSLSSVYLYHVLKSRHISEQLACAMVGATFKRINVEQVCNLIVPFPPVEEQAAIADRLTQRTAGFDGLVAEAEVAIALLQERRAALISAAVTGKIDVRGPVRSEAEAA